MLRLQGKWQQTSNQQMRVLIEAILLTWKIFSKKNRMSIFGLTTCQMFKKFKKFPKKNKASTVFHRVCWGIIVGCTSLLYAFLLNTRLKVLCLGKVNSIQPPSKLNAIETVLETAVFFNQDKVATLVPILTYYYDLYIFPTKKIMSLMKFLTTFKTYF